MPDIQIVKMDQGGANARILAKESKADFRRVEAASLKMPSRFTSADGKRYFVRLFNTLQLNTHFISVIARTRLDHDDIAQVEATIRTQIETVTENLNKAIDGAEALFKVNGITSAATYDTVPLDVKVGVLSSSGRRFLEVLGKLDQLMPLLQTLEIHEVISAHQVDIQRHSAVVAGVVTLLAWWVQPMLSIALLGWWSHIVIDVFTHSADYYPSPVFYPITQRGFDGLAWNTPWFLVANYLALGLTAVWLLRTREGRHNA